MATEEKFGDFFGTRCNFSTLRGIKRQEGGRVELLVMKVWPCDCHETHAGIPIRLRSKGSHVQRCPTGAASSHQRILKVTHE